MEKERSSNSFALHCPNNLFPLPSARSGIVTSAKIYMPHPILLEDWSSYDNRNIKGEKDPSRFSCHAGHPALLCQIKAPHPWEKLVECVVGHFVS
jgi:hypothetical protein